MKVLIVIIHNWEKRFGVGKKGMENMCLEELQYLNEEIRNKTTAFNISVCLLFIKH